LPKDQKVGMIVAYKFYNVKGPQLNMTSFIMLKAHN